MVLVKRRQVRASIHAEEQLRSCAFPLSRYLVDAICLFAEAGGFQDYRAQHVAS